eukprot:353939-Chlamydomonas_euryale.AAC.19
MPESDGQDGCTGQGGTGGRRREGMTSGAAKDGATYACIRDPTLQHVILRCGAAWPLDALVHGNKVELLEGRTSCLSLLQHSSTYIHLQRMLKLAGSKAKAP